MKQIRAQVEDTTSDYDREKLQERLAKLVGGVAVIKVGAATETEMKEKKARVEDAMHATKAAVEEGIVPGGGVALLRRRKALDKLKLEGDQAVGLQIIKRAIEEPMRWIAQNAGQEGSIVVSKVKEQKNNGRGLQRRDRDLRGSRQGRSHRSGEGRSQRAAERLVDRLAAADDRSAGLRDPRGEEGTRRRPLAWRPRHGRHVLTLVKVKGQRSKGAAFGRPLSTLYV